MSKTKKLDIFNLFYSGAAVVILIGVIAKLLEWPAQDLLITGGLAIEAVVFGVSAIKFIEVKKDSEVATEATLSKVAEGLGNLSTGNIVTGINLTDSYLVGDSYKPEYSESSWKLLEQMDVLTLTKDMFYHPIWVNLKSEDYAQLTQLFKTLFDKKLPNKDALPFLIKFPVAFPLPAIDSLQLTNKHSISLIEMEILWKSLSLAGSAYLFEKALIEEASNEITIRPRNHDEIQIFGGASADVIAHAKKFHEANLIVSPAQYYLQDSIHFNEVDIINYFIQEANLRDDIEITSLTNLLNQKSDETKKLLWDRFDQVAYDAKSGEGYNLLKSLVYSASQFKNKQNGSNLLLGKLEIVTDNNATIIRKDVVNYFSDVVYFGKENEYNVKLDELFTKKVLNNKKYFTSLIDQLAADKVLPIDELNQLFNLNKEDTVADLLKTLNHHLAKKNTDPTGAQLSFVLLCKVFINS